MSDQSQALSDLVWATLPLKDVLKGEQRVALMHALAVGTAALCGRHLNTHSGPPMHPKLAAEEMHRQALLACLALGVRPRDLVPQFNRIVDAGCHPENNAAYRLAKLGRSVAATANAMIETGDKQG